MNFFPGIDVPETQGYFPLPYRARSTDPSAGLSNYVGSARLQLAKKSDRFRSLFYGCVLGVLERIYILRQTLGYFVEGVNQDYVFYNNLIYGSEEATDRMLLLDRTPDGFFSMGGFPPYLGAYSARDQIGDPQSISHLKNPTHELAAFLCRQFGLLAYDYDERLHVLKDGFPHVGFSSEGYSPSSAVCPFDVYMDDGDVAGFLAFYASNACIPRPGLVQDAQEYRSNPQFNDLTFKEFVAEEVKWAWTWKDGDDYPVESLEQFVKKLPVSFGDVDFICAGAEGRITDKLSYAAAETVIPAISNGFAVEIDRDDGPLRFKLFGDAGLMISKDPGGVGPSGYDRTIERLLGNRSVSTGFMSPFFKVNTWPLHLLDAAILGPMQNRMIYANEVIEIRHVRATLSHSATASTVSGEYGIDLTDNDAMLSKIFESVMGDGDIDIPVSMNEQFTYGEIAEHQYNVYIENEDDHEIGQKVENELAIGFNGTVGFSVGQPWPDPPDRFWGKRRATRIIDGVEVGGWEYILSIFDLLSMEVIVSDAGGVDSFMVSNNTFTSPSVSVKSTHWQRILFPKGDYGHGVLHPCESLMRDFPISCISALARNSRVWKIVPMLTVAAYGLIEEYGGSGDKWTESGAVLADGSVSHVAATPEEIGEGVQNEGDNGWFGIEKDKFHRSFHDSFARMLDDLLFTPDDRFQEESAVVFANAMSALATESLRHPTLHDLMADTEGFMRTRDADLMKAFLATDRLTTEQVMSEAAFIFFPDDGGESSIRFSNAMFKLLDGFDGDIPYSKWTSHFGDVFATGDESQDVLKVVFTIGDVDGYGDQLSFGWRYQPGGYGSTTLEYGARAWVIGNMLVHGRGSSQPWPVVS